MKKVLSAAISVMSLIVFAGCATTPKEPALVIKTVNEAAPATIDFGPNWTGSVRLEKEAKSDLGDKAEVHFYSEWTLGESAGNVYPKQFTSSDTGNEENMEFLWDNGGDIKAGTYNSLVDIDGMMREGSLANLKLEKSTAYNIYISFNVAKIEIQLETDGDDIFVYPSGTYDRYEGLGRLDNIPEELLISHVNSYTEKNPIYWLIPAEIPLDILRNNANGDSKWFKDYIATSESFIKQLQ